jgi:hypothetical protein
MEAAGSSEMLVHTYQTTRYHIPEGSNLYLVELLNAVR